MDPISRLDAKLVALKDQFQTFSEHAGETITEMREIVKELGISIATVAGKVSEHEQQLQQMRDLEKRVTRLEERA